jgi:predicted glycogen debranching enzyme
MPSLGYALDAEWLEVDGYGGFASGTVSGIRTRRYHALLLTATRPPAGRIVLVNGLDAWLENNSGRYALSAQRYAPDVVNPQGYVHMVDFSPKPWPQWRYRTDDGMEICQEIFIHHDNGETLLRWRLLGQPSSARLTVRLFLSGRDYHALHRKNAVFDFEPTISKSMVTWHPYAGIPGISVFSNGDYRHEPLWYYDFFYAEEKARGLDHLEDLASPGSFTWNLGQDQEAVLILRAEAGETSSLPAGIFASAYVSAVLEREQRRRQRFSSSLQQAADMYIVYRETGKSIIAGYPWFTDWGRDTFIAIRGLCTANGRLAITQDILNAWADTVSQGMLPNRFPDSGQAPEYNSVDASLWYIIAVYEFLKAAKSSSMPLSNALERRLKQAIEAILSGYYQGTRFGIRMDSDGLLAAGIPGLQLTWMDAKVNNWVVTPRIGKPVEVQALWLNALRIGRELSPRWLEQYRQSVESFYHRFWNEATGYLYDVIDVDHIAGKIDASLRPNQIFAIGGLPFQILDGERAHQVMKVVEKSLLTPLGLRSLAPDAPDYRGRYKGGIWERDGAYHQGTVWPWLLGSFTEAWLRLRNFTPEARQEARERFLAPLLEHLNSAGIGHVSEITDGDPPFTPRGCPFQAWSLGELIRLQKILETSDSR